MDDGGQLTEADLALHQPQPNGYLFHDTRELMITKELTAELALKKFLVANLWIQLKLSELNYSPAENCGLSPEEYRLKFL
ncbi:MULTISPECIES: hypothetical protein [Pseudomonas]|uniref:hypothetical protein n=1 Tax=Pseudomonas TaxID=286 RepID=UPI002579F893|nr:MULTISPECIES: hypothetical protein [Pseudomonas]MDT3750587.1 hypothetical protein [Pseudomonas kurunegalensis]WHL27339.1 hypothetical protein QJS63_23235 [Pseudomonas juntendi]